MGMYQRGETYIHQRKFIEDSTATNVDSASMQVTYPCDSGVTTAAMANIATGTYEGSWSIPSNATYGEYRVLVTTVVGTETTKFEESFYILPWNIAQQVRSVSGIKQSNDISDDDIAIICWNAYLEAKEHVFKRVLNERLNEDAFHVIDGSNTTFYTKYDNIVSDHTVCDESAIYGYYVDSNYDLQDVTVSISDAETGKITVTKGGVAFSASDTCKIKLYYRTKSRSFSEQMFKKAVVYLASHEVILRFNELDKATLGDLNSNRPIILANPDRMYKKYKQTLKAIKKIKVGGV